MARVWVKGYTKGDGTKVPGHYRTYKRTAASAARTQIRKGNLDFPALSESMIDKSGRVVKVKSRAARYNAGITSSLKKTNTGALLARWSRMQRSKAMRGIR